MTKIKNKLTDQQYQVAIEGATEMPFSGIHLFEKRTGVYQCACCSAKLFNSDSKFESGTGWPSFFLPYDNKCINEKTDKSHGMVRTEIQCSACDAHLGHVFDDGPEPTGLRYCVNSVVLNFIPE